MICDDPVDSIMEALISLQVDRWVHGDLRINDIGNEVLDVLEAAVDEALLEVNKIIEEDVEACW